jgi:hypothetical protein
MSSNETSSEDAFGFGSVSSAKEKIRNIRPSLPDVSVDIARVDAVADNAGFVSREAVAVPAEYVYRSSRQARPEPRIPLNMRVPVSLGNAFQRFCEENRYSYPEALAEVLRRAGISTK